MNGKDLEKALLWEAPHIGEKRRSRSRRHRISVRDIRHS